MIIIIVIFLIIISYYILKPNDMSLKSLFSEYIKSFSNVELFFSDNTISLYKGDKSGENFIFGLVKNSYLFSYKDIYTLYEKGEALHIHNKVLITDYPITPSSPTYKKIKNYEITVWDSEKLRKLVYNEYDSNSSYSTSPLNTSNTSDDTCDIDDDPYDPIQNGAFNTHSIFSIFNNKVDHL